MHICHVIHTGYCTRIANLFAQYLINETLENGNKTPSAARSPLLCSLRSHTVDKLCSNRPSTGHHVATVGPSNCDRIRSTSSLSRSRLPLSMSSIEISSAEVSNVSDSQSLPCHGRDLADLLETIGDMKSNTAQIHIWSAHLVIAVKDSTRLQPTIEDGVKVLWAECLTGARLEFCEISVRDARVFATEILQQPSQDRSGRERCAQVGRGWCCAWQVRVDPRHEFAVFCRELRGFVCNRLRLKEHFCQFPFLWRSTLRILTAFVGTGEMDSASESKFCELRDPALELLGRAAARNEDERLTDLGDAVGPSLKRGDVGVGENSIRICASFGESVFGF